MAVQNTLSHLRNKQGISAKRLAELVGVQRQTIYAMEAGTYVPNTLVALRLAQVLGVKVEDLFRLSEGAPRVSSSQEVELLSVGERLQPGQPIQLCRVQKRVMGVPALPVPSFLPAADAVLLKPAPSSKKAGKALIQPLLMDQEYSRRVLIAGCDPGISVLGRHLKKASIDLVTAGCPSLKALQLLKQKQIHIAGSHLRDEATGESNLPVVRKLFPARSVTVVNFAAWEEGIVVAQGNPKGIRKVEDLARTDLRLVNRENGAGSRLLLDSTLRRLGFNSSEVKGYDHIASGHIPAAWHVHAGLADYCIATRAAARVFGLGFVPLVSERFDLVLPRQQEEFAVTQILMETLNQAAFHRELEILGGYDTSQTGKLLI
jgi:molybdate-binding protein/DNA-binding XRE family transcriptional regulator